MNDKFFLLFSVLFLNIIVSMVICSISCDRTWREVDKRIEEIKANIDEFYKGR